MKYLFFLLVSLSCLSVQAQVVFIEAPADSQLYARNTFSEAIVPVSGRVGPGYGRVSLQVSKAGKLFRHLSQSLVYQGNQAPFSFAPVIKAELANYQFQVYVIRGTDSTRVLNRGYIVAGDAYVINGQSNASAYHPVPDYKYTNEFIRTFGVYTANTNYDSYNAADTLWAIGNKNERTLVGVWAMEMGKRLTETYGVPVAFINGAAGGAPLELLVPRNAQNPADLSTSYGRLLYRVRKSGLLPNIRAYFFRQGENEVNGYATGWIPQFQQLYQNLRMDYPALRKIYLFQINVMGGPHEATAVFRDFQRNPGLPYVSTYATVGTRGFDGIHYNQEGYEQTGREMFRLVARDLYRSADTLQIDSPNIRKVYFASPAKEEVVLQFEEGQEMIWPGDTTVQSYDKKSTPTYQLIQWLYLDKQSGGVASGRVEGNRVYIRLKTPGAVTRLGYLPPNFPQMKSADVPADGYPKQFSGPFLKNRRDLRAFSFWEVPVAAAINPLTGLTAKAEQETRIRLTWNAYLQATGYILERRTGETGSFETIARLAAGATDYADANVAGGPKYYYRLRAVTPTAETTAEASAYLVLITSTDPSGQKELRIGPNPADQVLVIENPVDATVTVLTPVGQVLFSQDIRGGRPERVPVASLREGIYLLRISSARETALRRIWIRR
ncbi:T9SS type A sorting domain-containing protein [Siphonobacter aquaeclarae]|uniref:Por secretion system C-terminal sorting domain-containing protein n=1 Tax=Siphonobacter aquaeclarae TaxID=563176 RepID=A0A1G9NNY9_9BACT|nr:sialate O-acetylesterase [Siphonobacter aquaeclarae]SDL88109.1 Por secretion system C-terminal sorting domain-containing protein [Siphonobacter aquaeclarae]